MKQIPCVYMLWCSDNTLYTGWTNDLDSRIKTHNEGKGAKYTRVRRPVRLVYAEILSDRSCAMKREYEIKHLTRAQKLQLIADERNFIRKPVCGGQIGENVVTEIAAAILQKDGEILICQRGEGGNCAFLWEFPGGKREGTESFAECAIRECLEELDIMIEIRREFASTDYRYDDSPFHFVFYLAEIRAGQLKKHVHREIRWVKPQDLTNYPFCPADIEVIERLGRDGLQPINS